MKHKITLKHEFVEYIPNDLKEGTIYISIAFATAVHKCCCGCGSEVITPLSPTDWQLIFDGQSISLYPSIGNWNFSCQSHYWIINNKVHWVPRWSKEKINIGRSHDASVKRKYFDSIGNPSVHDTIIGVREKGEGKTKEGLWWKIKKWLF